MGLLDKISLMGTSSQEKHTSLESDSFILSFQTTLLLIRCFHQQTMREEMTMTTFEAIQFTDEGWIWRVTSVTKSADVLVSFEEVAKKLVKLLKNGAPVESNIDQIASKSIAWKLFKKNFL